MGRIEKFHKAGKTPTAPGATDDARGIRERQELDESPRKEDTPT